MLFLLAKGDDGNPIQSSTCLSRPMEDSAARCVKLQASTS